MGDDIERINRLLDDLAAERDPADRAALMADDVELAETAALLKAAAPDRVSPDAGFIERLGAQLAAARAPDAAPESTPQGGVSRRGLLGRIAATAAGLAVGAAGGVALRGEMDGTAAAKEKAAAYDQGLSDGKQWFVVDPYQTTMVPTDRGRWINTGYKDKDIRPGSAARFHAGALVGYLVHQPGKGIDAVSAVCTHMGCMLTWLDGADTFLCPCHGAQYNADGTVLSGIARHPLPPLKIRHDAHGNIEVWTVDEHPAITSVVKYNGF